MTDWITIEQPQSVDRNAPPLKTRPGFVPTPTKWAGYLRQPGRVSKNWKVTTKISKLRPGDYLIFPQKHQTSSLGMPSSLAGPPVQMSDGSCTFRLRLDRIRAWPV